MIIFGTGIDVIDSTRIKKAFKKNIKFKKKIFTLKEINYCKKKKNQFNCYANRFAAKEAFVKALGTGISNGLKFNEIEVYKDNQGKPYIKIHGKSLKIVYKILKKKNFMIFLSLSDQKNLSIALVIISI